MEALGFMLTLLLVHVHCGVLQRDDVEASARGRSRRLGCFKDCLEYREREGENTVSGIIRMVTDDAPCSQTAYCDMDTDGGGWTVFQRHQSDAVNFTRRWADYKNGFGRLAGDFWWGNDKLAQALNDGRQYELRIDLFDWEGEHRYAKYSHFNVAPESDNYRLNISGFTGNVGDSFWHHSGQEFSTVDRDNDQLTDPADQSGHCGRHYSSGFWFRACFNFNPNAPYSSQSLVPPYQGIIWKEWHGSRYSLKHVEMKFRAL